MRRRGIFLRDGNVQCVCDIVQLSPVSGLLVQLEGGILLDHVATGMCQQAD